MRWDPAGRGWKARKGNDSTIINATNRFVLPNPAKPSLEVFV
jgi:hypothetical protein